MNPKVLQSYVSFKSSANKSRSYVIVADQQNMQQTTDTQKINDQLMNLNLNVFNPASIGSDRPLTPPKRNVLHPIPTFSFSSSGETSNYMQTLKSNNHNTITNLHSKPSAKGEGS